MSAHPRAPAVDPPAAPDATAADAPRSPYSAFWGIYSDPADPSLFVPKRTPWLGYTLNAAHPSAPLALAALLAVPAAAVLFSRRAR